MDMQKDQTLPKKVNQKKTWYYFAYNHQYRIIENNRNLLAYPES